MVHACYNACAELQEANRDVLVGRRRVECLSCGEDSRAEHLNTKRTA